MKLKTLIAALAVAFIPATVWAGAAADSPQNPQEAYRDGSSVNDPSVDTGNTGDQDSGWQYVNGQATPSENSQNESSDTAMSDEPFASLQAPGADDDDGNDLYANLDGARDDGQLGDSEDATGRLSGRLEDVIGNTIDKVVIILPAGWQGSIAKLVAALEETSDSEILVLKPDGQPADTPSDSAEGEETPDSR